MFITLEDETGTLNVIVWKSLRETLHARLLVVHGVWQRSEESHSEAGYGAVRNLVARPLEDLTPRLGRLGKSSQDFHLNYWLQAWCCGQQARHSEGEG